MYFQLVLILAEDNIKTRHIKLNNFLKFLGTTFTFLFETSKPKIIEFHIHYTFCLVLFSVPPNIDDSVSSSDVIVREGSNISLRCRATGSPTPTVKWKRDDNTRIAINRHINYVGEF